MTTPTLVGPLLQIFFTDYLVAQKRLSLQTVASYRDTFRLLLQFVHRETGIEPVALPISTLDANRVLAFLDGLEKDRHNTIASRNLRLTAIRSFFRMVALREPAIVGLATRIVAIPMKRTDTKVRNYVTREEMDAVLASVDRTHWCGRRDYALLLTMYNAGARVSEIASLRQQHVTFGPTCYIQLHGKECHAYCISFRRRGKTTGTYAGRQACDLAFSAADVRPVVRRGIGVGLYTDAHGAGRVAPMSEPWAA
jgi:site-specific recombinase XerD